MGAIEGFDSTWTSARSTFGQGTPQSGAQYDGSGPLRDAQTTLQSAASGSRWTGAASVAYDAANDQHREVLGRLAGLDQRLSAQVDQAARIVGAGRTDLDAVRKWVADAAASVPPGKNREQLLMKITQKGLSQIREIVTKANGDLSTVGGQIRTISGEYQTLGNQKFAGGGDAESGWGDGNDDEKKKEEEEKKKKKDGIDDAGEQGEKDGESLADGQLSPEEHARLQQNTTLTPEQQTALDQGNVTIPPEQMAYLTELSHSLDGRSPAEIKATLDGLPPDDARAVSNALHLAGSDRVHTAVDPSLEPGDEGYVPATGGKENLPSSIREIFDAPLLDTASDDGFYDPNKPLKYLDEYRDIAAISNYGDPNVVRSSALTEGLLAQSREMLEWSEHSANPSYQGEWSHQFIDPTMQTLLDAGSHDPVAVHDLVAGVDGKSPNNQFIADVYDHQWADDGKAAGSLFPPNSDESARAGQVMHAFDDYAGKNYQHLLNIEDKQSLGQLNPALTQALAQANVPYIDDMVNADQTHGFTSLDNLGTGGDAAMPNTRGLFAVIGSDDTAANTFNTAGVDTWKGLVGDYSQSLVDGQTPAGGRLQAAGYLQRLMDQGEFLHQYDLTGDKEYSEAQAVAKREFWYDAAHEAGSHVPKLDKAIEIYDRIPGDPLRDFFVGTAEHVDHPNFHVKDPNEVKWLVAQYAVAEGKGNFDILGDLAHRDTWFGDVLDPYNGNADDVSSVNEYLSNLAHYNDMGWDDYNNAYGAGIVISPDELNDLKDAGA